MTHRQQALAIASEIHEKAQKAKTVLFYKDGEFSVKTRKLGSYDIWINKYEDFIAGVYDKHCDKTRIYQDVLEWMK